MRKDNKSVISGYAKHPPLTNTQESTQDNKQDVAILRGQRYNRIKISTWEVCCKNVFSTVFNNK